MTLRIDQRPFLITVDVLVSLLALYLLIRPTVRRMLAGISAVVIGALLGLFVIWLFGDVMDVFGVELTPVTRMWTAIGFAGLALALVNLFRSRWWRKVIAVLSIPVFLIAAGAGINVDFGAYRNLDDALGVVPYKALTIHSERGEVANIGTDYEKTWTPPASVPARGEIGTVRIPATTSGFPARKAIVYLPPAALTAAPPVLPVLYAFAGQPGAPADVFTAGHIATTMDQYAAKHGGIAPIVVAADQLGGAGRNPMCVDSAAFGKSATYLLKDVPAWIKAHFRVSSDPAAWSVFGYSQGATCAVQFATGHPDQFGSALASSSELGPTLGAESTTVTKGFGGSKKAYEAAQPAALMKAGAPFTNTLIVFGVGQDDAKYLAFAKTLDAEARAAGITSDLLVSPGSAHDWNTVRYTLVHGFPLIAAHLGLRS
ncbi:alpha/beta hydrolase [Leifsonia poae]|uniref:alpha/beta hydrolase n=1 Tax=Leifsonia poae TaxID=110933 RepID=UPI001CC01492|nr:alpha/beta hydrolase-fold protein [Leifsonia poae]